MNYKDKQIINYLQSGFPVCERPFKVVSENLGLTESELISRVQALLDDGILSRFGPMFNVEKMGGVYSLVAMQIPEKDVERVVSIINEHSEVAHNYERDHKFNIWFVVALDSEKNLPAFLKSIQEETGYKAYNMPKLDEYFVGLRFNA